MPYSLFVSHRLVADMVLCASSLLAHPLVTVSAHMGSVFARLIIDGQDYGVHVFLAQLRDPATEQLMPGVNIGDCGEKVVRYSFFPVTLSMR